MHNWRFEIKRHSYPTLDFPTARTGSSQAIAEAVAWLVVRVLS